MSYRSIPCLPPSRTYTPVEDTFPREKSHNRGTSQGLRNKVTFGSPVAFTHHLPSHEHQQQGPRLQCLSDISKAVHNIQKQIDVVVKYQEKNETRQKAFVEQLENKRAKHKLDVQDCFNRQSQAFEKLAENLKSLSSDETFTDHVILKCTEAADEFSRN